MSETIVEKSGKYVEDEENDEPFVHAEQLYTTRQDKNGRMQTVCVENPLAGRPKLITRYRAPNQRTDEQYLCMPFEPEKGSYLSLLSHELYLKIFWKACAGEHCDRMSCVSSITPVTVASSYRVDQRNGSGSASCPKREISVSTTMDTL